MKKVFILLLFVGISVSQIIDRHGISFRRSTKGTEIVYAPLMYYNGANKLTARIGFHLEDSKSSFAYNQGGGIVEISTKQTTYIPISLDYSRTLFHDSMDGSFRPMVCAELGIITGTGRIGDTFKHKYSFNQFFSIGAGAEFNIKRQKSQISVRYYSVPSSIDIEGNVLLDFTYYWG
jgi:hypothetical protein